VVAQAALGDEWDALREDGGSGYIGSFVEHVLSGEEGREALADAALGVGVKLEKGVEDEGVGAVVVGAATVTGGHGQLSEAVVLEAQLRSCGFSWHVGNPLSYER